MEIKPTFWPTEDEQQIFDLLMEVVKEKSPTTVLRLCGGIVRDRLLGIESNDIDIAISNMTGEQFCKLIAAHLDPNNKFTVIKANPDQSKHLETAMIQLFGINIDFVNLRKETYTDSRIPIMEIGTPEEDAKRRDLTINAIFYNINTGEIENYVNGLDDLFNQIAKTPIDPTQTFIDDPLRILRVIRFATKFNLNIDPEIIYACHDAKVREALKNKVTPERKFKEIAGYQQEDGLWKAGFFSSDNAYQALDLTYKMNILNFIFNDETEIFFHKAAYDLMRIKQTFSHFNLKLNSKDQLVLNLSIILMGADHCRLNNIEKLLLEDLKAPKEIFQRVSHILKEGNWFDEFFIEYDENNSEQIKFVEPTDNQLRHFLSLAKDDWQFALILTGLKRSIEFTKEYKSAVYRIKNIVQELGGWKVPCPITGKDLIALGIPAGKLIGEALYEINNRLLYEPNLSKEDALEICKKFLKT